MSCSDLCESVSLFRQHNHDDALLRRPYALVKPGFPKPFFIFPDTEELRDKISAYVQKDGDESS
jgi:hypothetical protein